jgi:carbonic anhydrase
MIRLKAKLATVLPSGAPLATSVMAQEHANGHWSYDGNTGPSHRGDLDPEFALCKSGHRQSPINIRATQKVDLRD